jgi:hypothetical protein
MRMYDGFNRKQSVIVAWRTKQEELDKTAAEEKDKVIKNCPFQRLVNTIFTKPKSKVNEEFHANFPAVDVDENCLNVIPLYILYPILNRSFVVSHVFVLICVVLSLF